MLDLDCDVFRLEALGRQEWDEDGREWGAVATSLGHELDNKLIRTLILIHHVLLFLIKPYIYDSYAWVSGGDDELRREWMTKIWVKEFFSL